MMQGFCGKILDKIFSGFPADRTANCTRAAAGDSLPEMNKPPPIRAGVDLCKTHHRSGKGGRFMRRFLGQGVGKRKRLMGELRGLAPPTLAAILLPVGR